MRIVNRYQNDIATLARRYGVARLELFGSATGDAFRTDSSDLDFLVAFDDDDPAGKFDAFFGLQHDLEQLLGHSVDLVSLGAIQNPHILERVDQTRQPIHVA